MFLPILKRESSSRTIAFECAEDRKLTPSIHSRSLSLERELRATTALPLKLFTAENVDALIEKFKVLIALEPCLKCTILIIIHCLVFRTYMVLVNNL